MKFWAKEKQNNLFVGEFRANIETVMNDKSESRLDCGPVQRKHFVERSLLAIRSEASDSDAISLSERQSGNIHDIQMTQ